MLVAVEEYSYVYIKLAILNTLLMTPKDRQKIQTFGELETMGYFIKRFFPNFMPEAENIVAYERSLWDTYFSIYEKIMTAAPSSIQIFLKAFLMRYEIWNIKTCIHSIIEKEPLEDRVESLFFNPEILLERKKFLSELVSGKSINDILITIKKTPYEKTIKRGLQKYQETGHIFYLEHDLDKFYLTHMKRQVEAISGAEKEFALEYVNTQIDYYNLNLLYRAYYNNVPIKIMKPYLIKSGYLFSKNELEKLCTSVSLDDLLKKLKSIFKIKREFMFLLEMMEKPDPNSWNNIAKFFLNQFTARFHHAILSDIPKASLAMIFKLILYKEFEIKDIRARITQISLKFEKAI